MPNLTTFYCYDGSNYSALLPVLIDSQLPPLKKLPYPNSYMHLEDYVLCALLLKDRLESLTISDDTKYDILIDTVTARFCRLYDRLDRFQKLKDLHITKTIENDLDFDAPDNEFNSDAPDNEFVTYLIIPRLNMKKLSYSAVLDKAVLSYIMQKYPQLNNLSLQDESTRALLDLSALSRFYNYTSKIDNAAVNFLHAKSKVITESFGVCQDISNKMLENLVFEFHLRYMDYFGEAQIHITKSSSEQYILVKYLDDDFDATNSADILEKYESSVKKT